MKQDRRREPRFECRQGARIVDLETEDSFQITIVNLSGRGMQLLTERPLAVNRPVRIDYGDHMLLGDVCYCLVDDRGYRCGIALAHSILGTGELAALMKRLEQEPAEARPADPVYSGR